MRWDAGLYDEVKEPQLRAGRDLMALAGVRRADTILDLGCGTGSLSVELASLASEGTVTAMDPSAEMIAAAKTRADSLGNMRLMNVAALAMEFEDEFDLVFSNSALQWVKEQSEVLRLVGRALKPGGRVAFQFPARDFCREFFQYAGEAVAELDLGRSCGEWVSTWYLPSKEEYARLLGEAGFVNVDVGYRVYPLLFDSVDGVFRWWASAGLRPVLEPLSVRQRDFFRYAFAMRFENNRTDRGIEFSFRRLFALAEGEG